MPSSPVRFLGAAIVLLAAVSLPARAQEGGLPFLRIGVNAAAVALGDAHVAQSRDAFSSYWNPAGLAAADQNSVAVSHHIWIGDVRTYSLASRFRAGTGGGLGLFVTAVDGGELELRDGPGDPDGLFGAQFISAGAAYGRSFGPLRAGMTFKFLSERIYTSDAQGYAFDFGVQSDLLRGAFRLGAALNNIGRMNDLSAEATPLPKTVRIGGAVYPFRILASEDGAPLLNTYLVAEVSYNLGDSEASAGVEDARTQFHAGVAAEVMELVTLRVGYLSGDEREPRRFSLGAGLEYGAFIVDYAVLPFKEGYSTGHVLTLAYTW